MKIPEVPSGSDSANTPSEFSLITNDPSTGYGFYNEQGQIANSNTAHEIANATTPKENELLQSHKETANELEKLNGGFLEIGRKMIEQHPNLFYTKMDQEGNNFVISKPIEREIKGHGSDTRLIVFSKENIARVVSEQTNTKYMTPDKVTPEVLSSWCEFFVRNKQFDASTRIDSDLKAVGHGSTLGLILQKLNSTNLFEEFVKKPIDVLIEENKVLEATHEQQRLDKAANELGQILGV